MTTNLGGAQYRRRALTALVVGGLLLAPAAVWALPQRLPTAQEETSGTAIRGNQVIAQGITRLPKGDLAWTIGRLDVPGEAGTTVDAFPVGFALADGASVAVLDDAGEVLNILDDGEASFLPNGKAGALASWRDDTAGVYEVALLSAGDAAASETPVTVVGNPFAAPNGRAFEIELARAAVSAGEEVTIPVSRSGAPTLFLQTAGTTQLAPPGGEPVELAAGQYALLLGEVIVRGVGDTPATFVAAAIGDTTGERDAAASGTPKAKAGKEDKQRAREGGGSGGGSASGAKPAKEKKAKGQRSGGGGTGGGGGGTGGGGGGRGGGQAQQQQPGGTGNAPVTGGVEEPPAAGTPAAETPQETVPASPSAPVETGEGTPAPEATTPEDENTIVESGAVGTPAEELPAGEGVVEGEELPTEETPPEETLPIEEAPAAEVPTEAAPAEEAPVEGEPTVDPNATG